MVAMFTLKWVMSPLLLSPPNLHKKIKTISNLARAILSAAVKPHTTRYHTEVVSHTVDRKSQCYSWKEIRAVTADKGKEDPVWRPLLPTNRLRRDSGNYMFTGHFRLHPRQGTVFISDFFARTTSP